MSWSQYKCRECGCEFDEPFTYVERHGFTHGPFEKWSECPCCGSCDFDDAYVVEQEEACKAEVEVEVEVEVEDARKAEAEEDDECTF